MDGTGQVLVFLGGIVWFGFFSKQSVGARCFMCVACLLLICWLTP